MTTTQDPRGLMVYPRAAWRKIVFRFPLFMWRLGFQPILGRVLLVLTQTGRKTGRPRHTIIEYHSAANGNKYVVSAFGRRAHWYKNIMQNPHVTIQSADGTEYVKARRVTDVNELLAFFRVLNRRNPTMTNWYLESIGIQNTPADILSKHERLYVVSFDPTSEPTPLPLKADLRWVWIGVVGSLIIRRMLRNR